MRWKWIFHVFFAISALSAGTQAVLAASPLSFDQAIISSCNATFTSAMKQVFQKDARPGFEIELLEQLANSETGVSPSQLPGLTATKSAYLPKLERNRLVRRIGNRKRDATYKITEKGRGYLQAMQLFQKSSNGVELLTQTQVFVLRGFTTFREGEYEDLMPLLPEGEFTRPGIAAAISRMVALGLMSKTERGKYQITPQGDIVYLAWTHLLSRLYQLEIQLPLQ